MPREKQKLLALVGALTLAAAILALIADVEALWPLAFGGAAATLVLAMTPVDDREIPHHPLKLPFFIAMAVLGVVLIAVGLDSGDQQAVVSGVFVLAVAIPSVAMIRRGHNPWWFRSWLDYRRKS